MKAAILLMAAVAPLAASTTATWEMSGAQDFLKGRFTGTALEADGRLKVAPALKTVLETGQTAIWSVAAAPDGSIYAGTGHGGKLYRIGADGKAEVVWTSGAAEIFAVAVSPAGEIFAASSPEGRIYKIAGGKAAEYFDPHASYIWALEFGKDGVLYAGTGNQGKIYRITAEGKGEVYYETGQSHVTALAVDGQGRLLAGTEPNGLIYRVTGKGKAFALYNSALPEIRRIVVEADGTILAAAMGGSVMSRMGTQTGTGAGAAAVGTAPAMTVTVTDSASAQAGPEIKPKPAATAAPAPAVTAAAAAIVDMPGVDKAAVYRIGADNSVETVWKSKDENVYDIAADGTGLYLATDVQGRVYRLGADRQAALVLQTGEGEATRLLNQKAGLLAATGDMGKLFRIGAGEGAAGWYEAPVRDAGAVARWGRLAWRPGTGKVKFETRAGNSARPDGTWSEWAALGEGGGIGSPSARYLQWRAKLDGAAVVESVAVAYLPQNAAPVVRSIAVSGRAAGATAAASSSAASYSVTVTDTADGTAAPSPGAAQTVSRSGAGQIQITWQAEDPDSDRMVYEVYLRAEGQREWIRLKERLTEAALTLDGDSLADGRYWFRVVASDSPSNPPETAREGELVSGPVVVDNTPPAVKIARAARAGDQAEVEVDAEDPTSALKRCEYSIDAGPWTPVEASDGMTDSPRETFLIKAAVAAGSHLVVVRVYDLAGNAGLAKVVIP